MKKLLLCTYICVISAYAVAQTNTSTALELKVTQEKNIAELTWTSSLEQEGDFFTLERSTDGVDFKILKGTIATNQQKYTTHDFAPYTKTYYRVKQTDVEAQISYSPIKSLKLSDGHFAEAYINPIKNDEIQVLVNLKKPSGVNIVVSDKKDRKLYNVFIPRSTGTAPHTIDMNDVEAGEYSVHVFTDDGKYMYDEKVTIKK